MKNIACIIVTYNRKELLVRCLKAVFSQSFLPNAVYVIDNASTDGTQEFLTENGFVSGSCKIPTGLSFYYVSLPENIGGAGGFYTGIKKAFDTQLYDGYWVMDDDGLPDVECLANLSPFLGQYDYIAPMVVDIDNSSKMAFEYCGEKHSFISKAENGIVNGVACPFNGILYSHNLVNTIGFPKKEMFIWGDEENYNNRAVKAGFIPVTIIKSVHRHPANRVLTAKSLFGSIDIAPQIWRCYCRYRNAMYNHREEMSFLGRIFVFVNHIWYFMVIKHSLKWSLMYFHAFKDGLNGNFTRLNYYKK